MATTTQLRKWKSPFGREYTNRNPSSFNELNRLYRRHIGISKATLNREFLGKMDRRIRILEVGSNIGVQLMGLKKMGFKNLYGIEPQDYAVELAKKRNTNINIIKGNVFDMPFKDGYFDLVFTAGVLIHINPNDIKKAIREIHRCSSRYIWGYEYYSKKYEEVIYRGKKDLLWKTNYAKLYLKLFDDLQLIKEKRLNYLNSNNVDTMFLLEKEKK